MTLHDLCEESRCHYCGAKEDGEEHRSTCVYYDSPLPNDFETLLEHTVILWKVRNEMLLQIHNTLRFEQMRRLHRRMMDKLVEVYYDEGRGGYEEKIPIPLELFTRWERG